MFDLTQVFLAPISLAVAVVTAVLIPWIRTKIGDAKWAQLLQIVNIAVQAAEQLYNKGEGEKKLAYALERAQEAMKAQGLTFDLNIIQGAIEATVRNLDM